MQKFFSTVARLRSALHRNSADISAAANIATSIGILVALAAFYNQFTSSREQENISAEQQKLIQQQISLAQQQAESINKMLEAQVSLIEQTRNINVTNAFSMSVKIVEDFGSGRAKELSEQLYRKLTNLPPTLTPQEGPDPYPPKLRELIHATELLSKEYEVVLRCIDLGTCEAETIYAPLCTKTQNTISQLDKLYGGNLALSQSIHGYQPMVEFVCNCDRNGRVKGLDVERCTKRIVPARR